MTQTAATSKQRVYFVRLTGKSLPSPCSRGQASRLINDALTGKAAPVLRVSSYRSEARDLPDDDRIRWQVCRDFNVIGSNFLSAEAAAEFGRTKFPGATVEFGSVVSS